MLVLQFPLSLALITVFIRVTADTVFVNMQCQSAYTVDQVEGHVHVLGLPLQQFDVWVR